MENNIGESESPAAAAAVAAPAASDSADSSPSRVLELVLEKVGMVFGLELAMGNWKLFKTSKHIILDKETPSGAKSNWEGAKLMSLETVLGKVQKVFEAEVLAGDWIIFTTEKHIIMEMVKGVEKIQRKEVVLAERPTKAEDEVDPERPVKGGDAERPVKGNEEEEAPLWGIESPGKEDIILPPREISPESQKGKKRKRIESENKDLVETEIKKTKAVDESDESWTKSEQDLESAEKTESSDEDKVKKEKDNVKGDEKKSHPEDNVTNELVDTKISSGVDEIKMASDVTSSEENAATSAPETSGGDEDDDDSVETEEEEEEEEKEADDKGKEEADDVNKNKEDLEKPNVFQRMKLLASGRTKEEKEQIEEENEEKAKEVEEEKKETEEGKEENEEKARKFNTKVDVGERRSLRRRKSTAIVKNSEEDKSLEEEKKERKWEEGGKEKKERKSSSGKSRLCCTECNLSFSTMQEHARHLGQRHKRSKVYTCETCGATLDCTASTISMRMHLRSHGFNQSSVERQIRKAVEAFALAKSSSGVPGASPPAGSSTADSPLKGKIPETPESFADSSEDSASPETPKRPSGPKKVNALSIESSPKSLNASGDETPTFKTTTRRTFTRATRSQSPATRSASKSRTSIDGAASAAASDAASAAPKQIATVSPSPRSSAPGSSSSPRPSLPVSSSSSRLIPPNRPCHRCITCDAVFAHPKVLEIHRRKYHPERVDCEDCGGVFGSEAELLVHVKESHDVGGDEDDGDADDERSTSTNAASTPGSAAKKDGAAVEDAARKASEESRRSDDDDDAADDDDYDEDEMAEFERMLKGGTESPPDKRTDKGGGAEEKKNDAGLTEAEGPTPAKYRRISGAVSDDAGVAAAAASAASPPLAPPAVTESPIVVKQEVPFDDDVLIESVVREPRRDLSPPIKREPVEESSTVEVSVNRGSKGKAPDESLRGSMENDPATLHMRRINRPLSKADVKAYFYPFMPIKVKIKKAPWANMWEVFFQFRSQSAKERAMRHGHLLHRENPLENLGFGPEGDGRCDEDVDPKLFFEDQNGKIVELEGVVKSYKPTPSQTLTSAENKGVGLPKIKLNLQQLQQLLGDKKSGLHKNEKGQLILKMPNKDIGQIGEKLKMLTQQQRAQQQALPAQQQQTVQSKSSENLGNVNIICPPTKSKDGPPQIVTNLSNVIFRGEEKRLIGDLAKASKAGNLQVIQVRKPSGSPAPGNAASDSAGPSTAPVNDPSPKKSDQVIVIKDEPVF